MYQFKVHFLIVFKTRIQLMNLRLGMVYTFLKDKREFQEDRPLLLELLKMMVKEEKE